MIYVQWLINAPLILFVYSKFFPLKINKKIIRIFFLKKKIFEIMNYKPFTQNFHQYKIFFLPPPKKLLINKP